MATSGPGDRFVRLSGTVRLDVPLLGPLALDYEQFPVDGSHNQQLIVLHARAGSATEDAIRFLTAISARPGGHHRKDPS